MLYEVITISHNRAVPDNLFEMKGFFEFIIQNLFFMFDGSETQGIFNGFC